MIDGMFQEGTDRTLDDQVSRPRPQQPTAPAFSAGNLFAAPFKGIGGGVAKSMAFGAEVIGAFGQGIRAMDQATPEQRRKHDRQGVATPEMSNEVGDVLRQRAADILPDPKTAHASEQIVAGLADFATRAIGYTVTLGPLAPFAFGGDAALEESDRLKQLGVDKDTRTKAGAVAGVLNAAAIAIPMTGPTAAARFVKGAGAGVGTIVGQSAAEREILRAAGYDKIADSFDPFDPVALALGVVPGVLGARFGKPAKPVGNLRTEADVRKAAMLTPEEQARSDAYERSPTNLAELERAIKAEKRPEVRALLETELTKQREAAGRAGVEAAVKAEPELVAAARVRQVVDAVDNTRLTPDDMLAGRDEHVTAVEMAADQMARGERVEVAQRVLMTDTPQEAGTVRLFAAGDSLDRPVRLSTDLAAVEALARKDGAGVHYMDLPADHPALLRPTSPEAGLVTHATAELPPELAGQLLQRLRADIPVRAAAAADQLRATRTPTEPKRAPARELTKPVAKAPDSSQSASAPSGKAAARSGEASPASVERAAADAQALDPEMLVQMEGMDAPVRVGDLLAKVQEEARQDTLLGKLVEVAAACDLTG